jgi:hypothetical protein
MWLRLALALGCSVREAQARISSAEFTEWCAYYQIEPFSSFAEWARWAQMMALLTNVHRRPGTRPARAQDFMPKPPQTSEDHLRILKAMFPPKHG